jgi:hypothetical protein
MLGAKALTPTIERVWGQNPIVRKNLGGTRGNLAIIRCRLISMAVMANNIYHLWPTTYFNKTTKIIPQNASNTHPLEYKTSFFLYKSMLPPYTSETHSHLDKTAKIFFYITYKIQLIQPQSTSMI